MKFQRHSGNIKRTTINATEVSEREEKVTRTGKKIEAIMAKIYQIWMRNIHLEIQEIQ